MKKLSDKSTLFEKSNSGPALPRAIVERSGNLLRYSGRRKGAYRIQRVDPDLEVTAEQLLTIIKSAGYEVIGKIPPGTFGSASGKYNTWILRHGEKEFAVVFGHGRNAGQKYEDQVLDDLQKSNQVKSDTQSQLYVALLKAFNIQQNQVKEIRKASERAVKRPITDKIENVGEIISDIDIVLKNGETIYISLKNKNGATFANSGYNGGFKVVKEKGALMRIVVGSHQLDDFIVNSLGVDKHKAAAGINHYIKGKPIDWPYYKLPTSYNKKKLTKYLASAYGYGYWYVRPTRQGNYQIVNIGSPQEAMNKVGEINSVVISYPYYVRKDVRRKKKGEPAKIVNVAKTSKQITAWVDTSTATYMVEVRNSHRGFNPNEIKVKIIGSKI